MQISVLINDAALENLLAQADLSSRLSTEDGLWRDLLFQNESVSLILYRVLTSYLLRFSKEPVKSGERPELFKFNSDLLQLVTDGDNDVFVQSLRNIDPRSLLLWRDLNLQTRFED